MHLVAVNDQVGDRSFGVGTVYGNAKAVAATSGSIAAFEVVLNVMDIVLEQFNMGARPGDVYTQGHQAMFGGPKVADLEALDPYVTFVLNGEDADSSGGSKVLSFEDCRLARITSECNESSARVAGCVDAHQFLVDSAPNGNRTAGPCGVCCVLNRAPRCRLASGVRIVPGRCHVEGGVCLAKGCGDASQNDIDG